MAGRRALRGLLVATLILTGSGRAWAHGDEELPANEQAEIEVLAMQPARVLAQQALALLEVRGDAHEAGVRLDAALESADQSDIDRQLLAQATETLDAGDPEGAVPLLDQALSRPLGAEQGKALHESGRKFDPGTGAQEVVGIVLGILLLLGGGLWLRRGPKAAPSS